MNLSRSLGDLKYKQNKKLTPQYQAITAYPEILIDNYSNDINFLIIACDGVWDCLSNQQACDFVKEKLRKDPLQKLTLIIEEMFDLILAKDQYDSI